MQISLEGKVAIVTGVSGDGQVGQAVAKALAGNGAQLAICARTQGNVEARAKELREAGARVLAVTGSLTDEAQVGRLIDSAIGEEDAGRRRTRWPEGKMMRMSTALPRVLKAERQALSTSRVGGYHDAPHYGICSSATNVRLGSEADSMATSANVGFVPRTDVHRLP